MADGGAPSVSCVGQSSVSQEGQMQFSGECTSTQSTMLESNDYQSIHGAALDGNNPDYQYDPMDALNLYDLKGLDFFDMDKESPFDLKDVRDVLPEDFTNSDQLVSHQSTTTEVTPQFPITTPDASGGETDRGYSSAGGSSQGQIVQEVAACLIHDNRNSCEIPALAAAASKKPATDNLVHEGGNKPGPVPVKIFDTNKVYLGEDTYTYYEPEPTKKRKKQCLPSRKRKHEEIKEVIRKTIQDSLKQLKRESKEERNEADPQQGPANQELRPADILKPLVYAGAQAGASELIEIIFNLPMARIIFEAYKNESCLPEDIAEENGHKEIAHFLRGITKRYSKENGRSPEQPEVIDWLALSKALEEIEFDKSGKLPFSDISALVSSLDRAKTTVRPCNKTGESRDN
ncbi:unnamed protein product [Porites evermanni]|uniref:Uncharacterized protein n=1 Tax=Porites evermanni TaxID=104178 RepID=A0ABN8LT75_9CNID|nr:unnamed protein product [Porites evermanni]